MTLMLASVTGPEEAEIAIAGGADIIDMKDPSGGALAALPVERINATLAAIGRRRPASAVTGDPAMQPEAVTAAVRAVAATGVDYVKVGLFPPRQKRLAVFGALAEIGSVTKLVAVLFADKERDALSLIPALADAGFAGVMLDTADKGSGRLLVHAEIPSLAAFVKAAHERGLLVGLAGGLEEPDVPRLLALQPDFLGFRGALCAAGRREAGIDPHAVTAIRRLIAPERTEAPGKVDYSLLSARGYHPDTADPSRVARIFVRDFVLPVRIGAYSHERNAPQKVRFDVTVEVQRGRGEPHGIGQVLSYDLITDAIRRIVAEEEHIDFVETLAERIAAEVQSDPRAGRITVRVEKLEVGPGGVGAELTLDRPDRTSAENPVLAMLDRDQRETR
ncbi:MAG: (5-formylfuran-3-yl)methyl phosphate synthase [Propylenella sp.]